MFRRRFPKINRPAERQASTNQTQGCSVIFFHTDNTDKSNRCCHVETVKVDIWPVLVCGTLHDHWASWCAHFKRFGDPTVDTNETMGDPGRQDKTLHVLETQRVSGVFGNSRRCMFWKPKDGACLGAPRQCMRWKFKTVHALETQDGACFGNPRRCMLWKLQRAPRFGNPRRYMFWIPGPKSGARLS